MKHALMALMLGLTAAPAWAQNPQPAPPHAPPPPSVPIPVAPPERIAPRDDGGAAGGTMSDQLSRDRGTLTPPSHVDPGMAVQPKNGGAATMPVIPPPGTPGGNPTVVPK